VDELERAAGGEARVIALAGAWSPPADARAQEGTTLVAVGSPGGLAALTEAG